MNFSEIVEIAVLRYSAFKMSFHFPGPLLTGLNGRCGWQPSSGA